MTAIVFGGSTYNVLHGLMFFVCKHVLILLLID